MENPSFQKDLERATELTVVKASELEAVKAKEKSKTLFVNQTSSYIAGPSTSCRGEVCQAVLEKFRPPTLSPSPWHKRKTLYLILTLTLFIIWIIIFTTLSQLNLF